MSVRGRNEPAVSHILDVWYPKRSDGTASAERWHGCWFFGTIPVNFNRKHMERIVRILQDGEHSCVIANGAHIGAFERRGVADLLDMLHNNPEFLLGESPNFSAPNLL